MMCFKLCTILCFRVMWTAAAVAAMSSITYPAISAFVSSHAEADQQGNCSGIHVAGTRSFTQAKSKN